MATRRAGNKRIYFSGDEGLQGNTVGSDYFVFLNIKYFFHVSVKNSFYQAQAILSNELLLKTKRP
jgi:hypothetical protein